MTAIEARLRTLESKSTTGRYQTFNNKGEVVEELPPGAKIETAPVLHIYDDQELPQDKFYKAGLVVIHNFVGGTNEQN